jgi:hypothetical protein
MITSGSSPHRQRQMSAFFVARLEGVAKQSTADHGVRGDRGGLDEVTGERGQATASKR